MSYNYSYFTFIKIYKIAIQYCISINFICSYTYEVYEYVFIFELVYLRLRTA